MEYRKYIADKFALEWPYPVKYGEETRDEADILVVGGGLAGCFAAISAAKRGMKVIVVDKAPIVRSGCAGAGIDHWARCYTNPCSKYTPDEMDIKGLCGNYTAEHMYYISMQEAWECLEDLEEYGLNFRDTEGEFEGAPFRDPETKLMFAYDYELADVVRLKDGKYLKPVIYKQMKKMGIKMYEHVMVTTLLTEDGKTGGKVIGAAGFGTRTGEFFVFSAKATIMTTAYPIRLWELDSEKVGSNSHHDDPNLSGDGNVMAWRAGAQLMMMERSQPSPAGRRYPAYMGGNSHNTWFPCTIVDANGKEIPWVDRDGNIIEKYEDRYAKGEGQDYWTDIGPRIPYNRRGASLIWDLTDRIMAGEYKLPFFADMTGMPDHERRAIFGLMLGNEGKTHIPVIETLTKAGFDPAKDMFMAPVLHPSQAGMVDQPWWSCQAGNAAGPNVRDVAFSSYGGIVVDWDLRSSLEGLYAAGNQVAGVSGASPAAAGGRYVGRTASKWAKTQPFTAPCEEQIEAEKKRIYAFTDREEGYGWKEIQIGLGRVMQDYCGDYKSRDVLELGLWWLNSIRENELKNAVALNPHDLWKLMDCEVRLSVCEIIMKQCLVRNYSNQALGFDRLDEPKEGEDHDSDRYIAISKDGDDVKVTYIPFDIYTQEGTHRQCYDAHCCKEDM